jgi:hypothetical protein
MFLKIVTIVFYAAIALFAFGVAFPYLMPILGLAALILVIAQFMS